jgi:Big-like domain-containing protein
MRRSGRAATIALVLLGLLAVRPAAEVLTRRATTLAAIRTYPTFFNGQPVLVRAELDRTEKRVLLVDGDDKLPALVASGVGGSGVQEIRGDVWDVGRMRQDDPRLTGKDLRPYLGDDPSAAWPKPGELVLLNVTAAEQAESLVAPSVRTLALAPARYVEQHVTVKGQFRGRNLFGDLPQAPAGADGRREFVIRSADAAIWVTGKQPKGRGFVFDLNSRLDTTRWLEVSGTVKWDRGLVMIVAEDLNETSPLAEAKPEQITIAPTIIPPEVLFSAPTSDETDVPLNAKVRIQFSRDLDPGSIKGHVDVGYSMAEAHQRGEPEPPPIVARIGYNPGARVMEISFQPGLERFRIVEVRLTEGIVGTDGSPLKPWSLKFTTGGS